MPRCRRALNSGTRAAFTASGGNASMHASQHRPGRARQLRMERRRFATASRAPSSVKAGFATSPSTSPGHEVLRQDSSAREQRAEFEALARNITPIYCTSFFLTRAFHSVSIHMFSEHVDVIISAAASCAAGKRSSRRYWLADTPPWPPRFATPPNDKTRQNISRRR